MDWNQSPAMFQKRWILFMDVSMIKPEIWSWLAPLSRWSTAVISPAQSTQWTKVAISKCISTWNNRMWLSRASFLFLAVRDSPRSRPLLTEISGGLNIERANMCHYAGSGFVQQVVHVKSSHMRAETWMYLVLCATQICNLTPLQGRSQAEAEEAKILECRKTQWPWGYLFCKFQFLSYGLAFL